MVVCPKCGRESVDGAKFCDKCGTALPAAPAKAAQPKAAPRAKSAPAREKTKKMSSRKMKMSDIPIARPEDMQIIVRPKHTFRGALIAVIIVALIIILTLGIALAVQTARLKSALELNETYRVALVAASSDSDNDADAKKGFGTDSKKDSKRDSATLPVTNEAAHEAYRDIVSDILGQIKTKGGSDAANLIEQSSCSLFDVNDDGIDELMLIYSLDGSKVIAEVYSLSKDGKIVSANAKLGTIGPNREISIYSGYQSSVLRFGLVSEEYSASDGARVEGSIFAFDGNSFEKIAGFDFSILENGSFDSGTIDGEQASEKDASKLLNSLYYEECSFGFEGSGETLSTLLEELR